MGGIHWIDWAVVIASLVIVSLAGGWFARRQKSTETYFVANRTVPGWAAGLSLYGSAISTQTFLAYPGHGFGGDWTRLIPGFTLPFVALFVIYLVIPFYRRVVRMSAYEFLERRFGYGARAYAGALYVLMQLFRMGIILFLMAKAIETMTHWDIRLLILVSGLVTVAYTVAGGFEAVIWTDVIQSIILLAGGIVCAGILLLDSGSAPSAMVEMAHDAHKFRLVNGVLDLSRPTLLVMILYGLSIHITVYTTSQDNVQRYLSVPTEREARKGVWITTAGCVVTWTLFMFIGTLLYSYYRLHPEQLPPGLKNDAVFPHFIMTRLPVGVIGLVLAAMIAAGMSSLSACINTMSLVSIVDFYSRFRPGLTDRRQLVLAKLASCLWGVLGTLAGLSMIRVEQALDFSFKMISILGGGLFGMFLLALFVRRAHALGVYIGLAAGVIVTAWGTLDEMARSGFPVPLWLGRIPFPCHPFLLAFCSNALSFIIGYVASLILPPIGRKLPAPGDEVFELAGFHRSDEPADRT